MIVFPNCKINLGLRILYKRTDGYHELETVFYPLRFCDILEVIRETGHTAQADNTASAKSPGHLFSQTGMAINGQQQDNLCIRAYDLLKKDFPQLPAIQMHLHKSVPAGAGLGGGSADAAFTLRLLNEKFKLALSTEQLIRYALQLGSDCPFFIINQPCYATGRGEIMEEIAIHLSDFRFIVVNPGIHISTADAFAGITPALPLKSTKEIIGQPIETWQAELKNDFEETVFARHPEIAIIKTKLYEGGAVYASMSGTGSTVYGIFKKEAIADFNFPPGYFIKKINVSKGN